VNAATGLAPETLRLSRLIQGDDNALMAVAIINMAVLLFQKNGTWDESLRVMDDALDKQRRLYGVSHSIVARSERFLAEMERVQKVLEMRPKYSIIRFFDNVTKNRYQYEIMTQTSKTQGDFKLSDETNPQGLKRFVYLKVRPLPGLVEKFQYGRMAKLASLPFLAHWAIEVRPDNVAEEWEGPTWEIRPTADTDMRLEMAIGRWFTPEQRVKWKMPYIIKSTKVKVGTTKLKDAEINAIGKLL
jgi:hypothetical protein